MQKLRLLLLPFSWIYGAILWLRNVAYNRGMLPAYVPKVKTVVVGNIALGGTGKTPHIEYILALPEMPACAVLSRGYGRESHNTLHVTADMPASLSGDEPLQMARKFPDVPVVVDANRRRGIAFITQNFPETEVILLDDAMQHRKIKGGFHILLTTFNQPFFKDHYLPAGNLRDHKIRARDADLILVSKCPAGIDPRIRSQYEKTLHRYSPQVGFDRMEYLRLTPLREGLGKSTSLPKKVLAITGIAKPEYFIKMARTKFEVCAHYNYPDHYRFVQKDLTRFRKFIGRFAPGEIAILTTEKDAMRLKEIIPSDSADAIPVWYWEIGIDTGADKNKIDNLILAYARKP